MAQAGETRGSAVAWWLALAGLVAGMATALSTGSPLGAGVTTTAEWSSHLAGVALAMGAFAALVWNGGLRSRLTPGIVFGLAGALLVAAVIVPPRESRDVWAHVMYGRILAVHHANPYRHPPSAYPGDPWLARVGAEWRDTKSVYGAAYTALSAAIAKIVGDSATAARVAFQTLAAMSILLAMLLVYRRRSAGSSDDDGPRPPGRTLDASAFAPAAAAAWIGLNPIVILGVANAAHNDGLVGLASLAGALVATMGPAFAAGLIFGLGASVKIVALVPAAATSLWVWRRRSGGAGLWLAAGAAVPVVAGSLAFGGVAAVSPVWSSARAEYPFSVWQAPHWIASLLSGDLLHASVAAATRPPGVWPTAVTLAAIVVLTLPAVRTQSPYLAASVSLLTLAVVAPWSLPWYVSWSIPLLGLMFPSPLSVVAFAAACQMEAGYLLLVPVHGTAWQGPVMLCLSLAGLAVIVGLVAAVRAEVRRASRAPATAAGRAPA